MAKQKITIATRWTFSFLVKHIGIKMNNNIRRPRVAGEVTSFPYNNSEKMTDEDVTPAIVAHISTEFE